MTAAFFIQDMSALSLIFRDKVSWHFLARKQLHRTSCDRNASFQADRLTEQRQCFQHNWNFFPSHFRRIVQHSETCSYLCIVEIEKQNFFKLGGFRKKKHRDSIWTGHCGNWIASFVIPGRALCRWVLVASSLPFWWPLFAIPVQVPPALFEKWYQVIFFWIDWYLGLSGQISIVEIGVQFILDFKLSGNSGCPYLENRDPSLGLIHTRRAGVTPTNGTRWCQWECSHCLQATSKEKRSNLCACRVTRAVWIRPYVAPVSAAYKRPCCSGVESQTKESPNWPSLNPSSWPSSWIRSCNGARSPLSLRVSRCSVAQRPTCNCNQANSKCMRVCWLRHRVIIEWLLSRGVTDPPPLLPFLLWNLKPTALRVVVFTGWGECVQEAEEYTCFLSDSLFLIIILALSSDSKENTVIIIIIGNHCSIEVGRRVDTGSWLCRTMYMMYL